MITGSIMAAALYHRRHVADQSNMGIRGMDASDACGGVTARGSQAYHSQIEPIL
jgi:hypothetical protein